MLKHLLFPAKPLDPKDNNYVQKCVKLCCPQPWGSCGQQRLQKAGTTINFFPLQNRRKKLTLCFLDLFRHLVWNQLIKAAFKTSQSQVPALPVLLPSPLPPSSAHGCGFPPALSSLLSPLSGWLFLSLGIDFVSMVGALLSPVLLRHTGQGIRSSLCYPAFLWAR